MQGIQKQINSGLQDLFQIPPLPGRLPSYALLYWSPGQALPKALSLLVFSHPTNGNGQFACLFLTVDSAGLAHNGCDSGIPSPHTGPGREEASGLVQLTNGWLNERTKTETEPTGPSPSSSLNREG